MISAHWAPAAFTAPEPDTLGKLRLRLTSALGLNGIEGEATIDPFALLSVGAEEQQSHVVKKNANPQCE